jgi:hypothetical protein
MSQQNRIWINGMPGFNYKAALMRARVWQVQLIG